MALYDVAGLPGKIALPVPLIINLIPVGQTNQRPGISLRQPPYWIQHETGNPRVGMGALAHRTYLHNGAPDQYGNPQELSFHFAVDDRRIYQMIPINEVTWQAADSGGPGNYQSISCELCINSDGDFTRAWHNAAALCGAVMHALGRPASAITRHWDRNWGECCSGPCDVQCGRRHHCPDQLMSRGLWPAFVSAAAAVIDGGTPMPNPDPDKPIVYAPGVDSELCARWFGGMSADGSWYAFDPDGPVTKLWLTHGLTTGAWPQLVAVDVFRDSKTQTRRYFRFAGGFTVFATTGEAPRVLMKAA